jgi:cytochrome c oxidase cbb3-type subunit III
MAQPAVVRHAKFPYNRCGMNPSPQRWVALVIGLIPSLLVGSLGALPGTQAPAGRPTTTTNQGRAGGQTNQTGQNQDTGRGRGRTASQAPPPTVTPQSYPSEQVDAGRPMFASRCGFCHGRDAAGGETGPDLTRSEVVAEDYRGDKLMPFIREGRTDKGMPGFNLPEADLAAIVAFIHDQKAKADSQEGSRRTVDDDDLETGDPQAGREYFNGAGGCSRCHSPTGDLDGIASRLEGLELLQRMLYPSGRGSSASPATVTVTTRDGETITGRLAYRDEFTIALVDASGWHRSWPAARVKFVVDNPLDAHSSQLGKYTDADMHNVLAYLRTLW